MQMPLRTRLAALVLGMTALLAVPTAWAAGGASEDEIPAAIAPADALDLRLRLSADGVQIYDCQEAQPGQFEWKFRAPEAKLRDARGAPAGIHGAGPVWEMTDGAKISGKVLARAPSPDGKSIPWLLIESRSVHDGASLAGVTHVQRVLTSGGAAPAQGCSAATVKTEARVPYAAVYRFLGPAANAVSY